MTIPEANAETNSSHPTQSSIIVTTYLAQGSSTVACSDRSSVFVPIEVVSYMLLEPSSTI